MTTYPRFSVAERRRLTMSRRATESFRTIGIRGGADPSQGVPGGNTSYYELSESDRALIEQVLKDNQSSDANRAQTALDHWNAAVQDAAPRFGALASSLYAAGKLGPMLMDWLGLGVRQNFSVTGDAGGLNASTSSYTSILTSFSRGAFVASGGGGGFDGHCDISVSVAHSLKPGGWTCTLAGDNTRFNMEALCFEVVPGATSSAALDFIVSGDEDLCGTSIWDAAGNHRNVITGICPDPRTLTPAPGQTDPLVDGIRSYVVRFNCGPTSCFRVGVNVGGTLQYSGEICADDDGYDLDALPDGVPEISPLDTPADFTATPDELCDLADALKDYPFAPDPGAPVGTPPGGTPPIDPGTGLPPGTVPEQPPDPGANPGTGEPVPDVPVVPGDPALPPGDPGLPVTPEVPPGPGTPVTDPIDSGIEDPLDGGCNTVAGEPAGFRDPAQPGGISRKFQPGQPVTIDYGAGSTCRVKITRVKQDKDLATGEKGTEICVSPTLDNGGKTTEKTCYGPGPVTEAISSVLGDMIAEGGQIIFDSDCTRELARPMCFRAGTSKRVILDKLLAMCGFCVFPMFDCNVIVGYCGPVNVHWTYHEDVDLMAFDVEYDNLETYDYVQVFRGDRMNQSGQILEPGGDVFYPVGAPASSVNGDRVYQHEVPYGTSQTDMLAIAMDLAAKYRMQAMPLVAFGVPLNSQLLLRHQIHFKRPSLGFNATYMVTRIVRDYDRENGHLSTGLARWLSGS